MFHHFDIIIAFDECDSIRSMTVGRKALTPLQVT